MMNAATLDAMYQKAIQHCAQEVQRPRGQIRRRKARRARALRDASILALTAAYGLAAGELVRLDVADVDLDAGTVTVRGKGDRGRVLPLRGSAIALLSAWVDAHGGSSAALFLPLSKYGRVFGARMSARGLLHVVTARLLQGQRQGRRAVAVVVPSLRDFRSHLKERLRRLGVRDGVIRKLLGLATRRPVTVTPAELAEAVEIADGFVHEGVRLPRG